MAEHGRITSIPAAATNPINPTRIVEPLCRLLFCIT